MVAFSAPPSVRYLTLTMTFLRVPFCSLSASWSCFMTTVFLFLSGDTKLESFFKFLLLSLFPFNPFFYLFWCLYFKLDSFLKWSYFLVHIYLKKIFLTFIYFWDRERQSMNGGGEEREGDTESEAGSRLWAISPEPDAGLELTDRKIATWAEVGRSTNWATHAPPVWYFYNKFYMVHWINFYECSIFALN